MEELLVTKVSACIWRTRRLLRYESGNIANSLAERRFNLQSPDLLKLFDDLPSRDEINTMVDHLSVPLKPITELIIHYDAMLDKQLRNTMAELERLQCRRREQAVDVRISTSSREK
jgi:hypothetical protein